MTTEVFLGGLAVLILAALIIFILTATRKEPGSDADNQDSDQKTNNDKNDT